MPVIGADRKVAGTVTDIWVDRSEPQIRYSRSRSRPGRARHVLLPITMAKLAWQRAARSTCTSILAAQFADVPGAEATPIR